MSIPGLFTWLSEYTLPSTLAAEMAGNVTWATSKDGYGALAKFKMRPARARMLLCAGSMGDPIGRPGEQLEIL